MVITEFNVSEVARMAEWMDQTNVPHLFAGAKGESNIPTSVFVAYILPEKKKSLDKHDAAP